MDVDYTDRVGHALVGFHAGEGRGSPIVRSLSPSLQKKMHNRYEIVHNNTPEWSVIRFLWCLNFGRKFAGSAITMK